jgi:GNAT superfamily N-acetyltransferase
MVIEPATLEDCLEIAQVHVLSWRHTYQDILTADYLAALSVAQREYRWREWVAADSPHVFVAKDEGKVVGFIAFGLSRDKDATANCAEIWAIYLAPSHCSQGIGRKLWLAAHQCLLAQGFKTVSLWVFTENTRAINFYLAIGFKLDPNSASQFTCGGISVDEVRCVFTIAP